ncbi:hypothetical protein ADUPG1_013568 [Aduncisulcus paluster]|uniref:NudC domain-containing protein 1 n=1 Tax=Aduncisulcus paluster TaxID=2918883 RepID=A0ABQ5K3H1_9EUKA|nr:hypothetical protein ADUPG1_013568 [Aduncisulcus paluster]
MSKLSFATLCFRLLLFLRCKQYKIYYPDSFPLSMSSSTDIQIVKPEFIHEGDIDCCPIPRDAPNIKSSEIPSITPIDETQEEYDEEYDQSVEAEDMMRGEVNNGHFTHISIPFSLCSPMKGVYICLFGGWYHPEYLTFTLTSSKGDKISKKYEFSGFEGKHWYFLSVDLPDVVLCEIRGKRREEENFCIESLVLIRQETSEEITSREAREKLWSEAPVVKSKFVKEGDYESDGRDSIPIPRDDPKLVAPLFSMVKCKDDSLSKESEEFDKSSQAQRMLKGEDYVYLSHLSIPFPSPSPMKGAYICVDWFWSSPSLLFTFTDCDGKKTFKKYEFTEPEHDYEWHFLPIDLDNVVLCEIEGKGRRDKKNCVIRSQTWHSTPFSAHYIRYSFNNLFVFLSDNQTKIFIYKVSLDCASDTWPIPLDAPNIRSVEFPAIKARNETKKEVNEDYDQSSNAQKMMKGEEDIYRDFTHISIPFSSSSSMKGAYLFLSAYSSPPSHLIFTLTNSKGRKRSKKFEFPEFYDNRWYFLPIDLSDVVLCEIIGKGRVQKHFSRMFFQGFCIRFLAFIRKQTSEEIIACKAKEKLWSETIAMKPEFIKKGYKDSIPIPRESRRDYPKLLKPAFSMVTGNNNTFRKESKKYDQSSEAQKMLKGEEVVGLSHLSIPFPSPSPMKGAYICVNKCYSSPSLLFTFTDCDGKKTSKKYEFTEPKHWYEWYFLPIDLMNVILCEIEGKGTWREKHSRYFCIDSLVFTMPEESEIIERLSLLPWE